MWSSGWALIQYVRPNKDTDTPRGKTVWGNRENRKLKREASEETSPANILISDFQSPELSENEFLLFKPSSLWSSVMAATRQTNAGGLVWRVIKIAHLIKWKHINLSFFSLETKFLLMSLSHNPFEGILKPLIFC